MGNLYLEYLDDLNKKLIRNGIRLPLDLSVDEMHIFDQIRIIDDYVYFNHVLEICDSGHKISRLICESECGYMEWLKKQIRAEYEEEWRTEATRLLEQPVNAGEITSNVELLNPGARLIVNNEVEVLEDTKEAVSRFNNLLNINSTSSEDGSDEYVVEPDSYSIVKNQKLGYEFEETDSDEDDSDEEDDWGDDYDAVEQKEEYDFNDEWEDDDTDDDVSDNIKDDADSDASEDTNDESEDWGDDYNNEQEQTIIGNSENNTPSHTNQNSGIVSADEDENISPIMGDTTEELGTSVENNSYTNDEDGDFGDDYSSSESTEEDTENEDADWEDDYSESDLDSSNEADDNDEEDDDWGDDYSESNSSDEDNDWGDDYSESDSDSSDEDGEEDDYAESELDSSDEDDDWGDGYPESDSSDEDDDEDDDDDWGDDYSESDSSDEDDDEDDDDWGDEQSRPTSSKGKADSGNRNSNSNDEDDEYSDINRRKPNNTRGTGIIRPVSGHTNSIISNTDKKPSSDMLLANTLANGLNKALSRGINSVNKSIRHKAKGDSSNR